MEDKKKTLKEEESPDTETEPEEEDLLYTHKPDTGDSSMRWNSSFCRRPGR